MASVLQDYVTCASVSVSGNIQDIFECVQFRSNELDAYCKPVADNDISSKLNSFLNVKATLLCGSSCRVLLLIMCFFNNMLATTPLPRW